MGFPAAYAIGTPFGRKGSWAAGYHTGVDILTPTGTILKASIPSKVIHAGWGGNAGGWGPAYGNQVICEVTSGSMKGHRYSNNHMSSVSVRKGQIVAYGQALGRSGATGNVTGPHDHFEVRVPDRNGNYGYWQHINPAAILDWKPTPVFRYPAKPKLGKKWAKVRSQNCAYNNDHGVKTGTRRFDGLIEMMVENQTDLLACQELPTKWRNKVDAALKRHHMERMAGNYGRYTYGDTRTVKKIKGKSVTPKITAGGAKKPYTLLDCYVRKVEMLHVNVHLKDGAAWANHRRKYIRAVMPDIIEYAEKECGLPKHRIVLQGDWNGHKEVVEEMAKFGFYATYGMSHKKTATQFKTTNQKKTSSGWTATAEEGKPIDMTFTTASRPSSLTRNRRHGYSDHGSNRAILTYGAK